MLDFFRGVHDSTSLLAAGWALIAVGIAFFLLGKSDHLHSILDIQARIYRKHSKSGLEAASKVKLLRNSASQRLPVYGLAMVALGLIILLSQYF
ncbi:hypothetical protein [Denitromonas iodatirespirans]|uniref:DUF3899 domain-containing protein n=1 Tax=Denitromonas iodatirespirans TaxID=2795389 RepID=A0A944DCK8_DENI1|nr:hypothetical protein [Denitromonas iodatirespirans]MBT0960258.1 hypothetical protein [Denitromonas iodatirespirans]